MGDTSLTPFGDLGKPANTLIKKISDAVGGIFKPFQIVRVAQAEAEADKIRAESQIQVTDLQRRAMYRFIEEEAKLQANIESITAKALPLLDDNSSPQNMDDDWITNFFDKSRIVSDPEMQQLWSSVLAGEANTPGTFSRRTVNLIADLDKSDAQLFTKLCGFGWMIGNVCPLVFDVSGEIYNRNGINFGTLVHLETLGLIRFDHLAGFTRLPLPKAFKIDYFGKPLKLEMEKDAENVLVIGKVLLTNAGQQLAPISGAVPVDGFFEYVCEKWEKGSPSLKKVFPA
jgi:hypothetical protein